MCSVDVLMRARFCSNILGASTSCRFCLFALLQCANVVSSLSTKALAQFYEVLFLVIVIVKNLLVLELRM